MDENRTLFWCFCNILRSGGITYLKRKVRKHQFLLILIILRGRESLKQIFLGLFNNSVLQDRLVFHIFYVFVKWYILFIFLLNWNRVNYTFRSGVENIQIPDPAHQAKISGLWRAFYRVATHSGNFDFFLNSGRLREVLGFFEKSQGIFF